MSTVAERPQLRSPELARRGFGWRRIAPTLLAAAFALAYVILSPPSLDLAAHLLRAKLFSAEGLGIWNNWWYAGHHTPSYSVLFPPLAALLSPQLAAGIAATATAAVFEPLARRRFGEQAWLGAVWFGGATATNLFTGRLTFAFGLLPAVGCALALQRRRTTLAPLLALVTALASPVAALFAALAGAAYGIGSCIEHRRLRPALPGLAVVLAALVPVALLGAVFPEGGTEPFTFATLWPVLVISVVALFALPKDEWTLRAGVLLYALGCIVSYEVATPVGSNAARLGTLLAGPLAAVLWWRRRAAVLLVVAPFLLYIQWQAPVRDVRTSSGDPSASAAYWKPLLSFLSGQPGQPFRVEVPFTQFHFEAYQLAPRFPLARGWERQLDIKYNHLFYSSPLTPAMYAAWLHEFAIRFVAVADVRLDYAGRREKELIDGGLPYLHLVLRTRHWRVYALADPTPIAQGSATLHSLGPDSLTLLANRAGTTLLRVHFTPYWVLGEGSGCVARDGEFTRVTLRHAGPARLAVRFAIGRIRARSPRCN